MSERIYNVLFLCTGNSARSVLAESILRKDGRRNFCAFSAGSQPKGTVNPFAIKVLRSLESPPTICARRTGRSSPPPMRR
jgi:protein-tyrosine-phosphatase